MTSKETLDTAVLRRLGFTIAVVLAIVGWFFLLADLFGAFIFSFAAIIILITALIKPSLLKGGEKLLVCLSKTLQHVIPLVILIILFYLVVTPIGLFRRFFGRDHSSTHGPEKNHHSYWIVRKPALHDREQMKKQY